MALACIGIAFNMWFVQNTNAIIESLVSARSEGRIQLQLDKSSFQYLNKRILLRGATFYATDTSDAKTTYQFSIPRLNLKIRSFWPFFLYRELLLDSITLNAPVVTVTRLSRSSLQEKESVSIPEEIGRVYNSILDALEVLQVKRFQIDDGRFHLVNKIAPHQPVTTISNIHFHISNLNINSDSTARDKFLYSDNVVLRVHDQNIALPDGIHHVAFKNLLINAGRKQVQLDSCWVKAETENDRNAFRIFFDVLKLTNLDFAALSKRNEIKADSVYVDNPDMELALELKKKRERGKKLELDTIIQRFTGDLNLGYIGVQNAVVNIIAHRGDTTTTFSSKNDNFKMYGLRINSDSAQPVHVDEFAMILRDYETYSRDSSTVYRFDSLRFTNKKVRLSNFTIRSINNGNGKPVLYYSIPAFELTGLSWEDLLFDRYISADRAVLLNPEIQYTVGAIKRKGERTSLFKILSGLNETLDLDAVEIQNGNLNINFAAGKRLSLQHVDLALASNRLLASTSYTGMQQAIEALALRSAVFTTDDLRAELRNLKYADRLYADDLRVTDARSTFVAQAKGISLHDLVWNNPEKSVFVDHLGWQQANVVVRTSGRRRTPKATNAQITLKNLSGKNTALLIYAGNTVIKTTLNQVTLGDVMKKGADAPVLQGLQADGNAADIIAEAFRINTGAYHVTDKGNSSIRAFAFLQQSAQDTIRINIPQTFLKAHIQGLLDGNLRFDKITASKPALHLTRTAHPLLLKSKTTLPRFAVAELNLLNPDLLFIKEDTARTTLHWSGAGATDGMAFYNVRTVPQQGSVAATHARLHGSSLRLVHNGKPVGVDSGAVQLVLGNIAIQTKEGLQWNAFVQHALFQNPMPLSLKNGTYFRMAGVQAKNLHLASGTSNNIYQLLQANPAVHVSVQGGNYTTGVSTVQWQNLEYYQKTKSISIDSFSYKPVLPRDSFISQAPGQVDYMHALLKNIAVSGIDLAALERDGTIAAQHVVVDDPQLHLYRDKQKPFIPGALRPLPVAALQNLPLKLAMDTVTLQNGAVSYTEKSVKTGQEGTVFLTRIDAQLFPVRNFNLDADDSLTLRADGYLMDSAWMRLRLKESYMDSLGTFALTLRMRPTTLSFLNPVLMPLASIKLASGYVDTVVMRAVGNEYFSIGTMQLYYDSLKIQFLAKGSETKKSFLSGLITFAANNFVIRTKNDRRTGIVYFLRNRDRGLFNFLIKTALSGIASSVGARRNKTYYRQYKRQQKLYKLPPVDLG